MKYIRDIMGIKASRIYFKPISYYQTKSTVCNEYISGNYIIRYYPTEGSFDYICKETSDHIIGIPVILCKDILIFRRKEKYYIRDTLGICSELDGYHTTEISVNSKYFTTLTFVSGIPSHATRK